MTVLHDAALNLAAHGFRVFPCRVRSKEPLINDNLNRATTDANVISGWWSQRQYNIGIATGAGSDVWVLDIDGEQGEQTLRNLEAKHGKLPTTAEVISGNGRHLYFRWPDTVEIRNTQARTDMPGIDARGEGGYIIAPPSVHPNGTIYRWSDIYAAFVAAPGWLLDAVTKHRASGGKVEATPPDAWCSFLGERVDGSRRGGAIARLSGLLLRYLDPMVALDLVRLFNAAQCEPPLGDDEVVDIVVRICERDRGEG